jgi:hypothetical protein
MNFSVLTECPRSGFRIIFLLSVSLASACAPNSPSLNYLYREQYPLDLVQYMNLHGCQPDMEFLADHSSGGRPPFLYGFLTRQEDESAIMWCYRMEGSRRRNLLLIMAKTENARKKLACPKAIESEFLIGSLSHGTANYLNTLEGFAPIRQSGQSKIANSRVSLPAEHIVSTRRGEVTVFACHEGEWWVYRYD